MSDVNRRQWNKPQSSWERAVVDELNRLETANLRRRRYVVKSLDATHVEVDGHALLNFSSNDYLGLSYHPALRAAIGISVTAGPFGSAAAPLISGYSSIHESAEKSIAAWKGTESAVIFPSGYQANLAAIQALAAIGKLSGGVRFLVDKLAHASLIDAVRGSGEQFRTFPHNHLAKLTRLLQDADADQLQVVVTESIFSMDGDAADLRSIAELKRSRSFLLLVDEAHATGVYGPVGSGLTHELDLSSSVDVSIFTLSKALGGVGGVVCGSNLFCNALINFGRAYLYSTAVPPCVAAAAEAAIGVLRSEPERQIRIRQLARNVRSEFNALGLVLPPGDSPIIPIILGTEVAAIEAANQLRNAGLLVVPVRPPTVAKGSSRLRITLSSSHTDEHIGRLIEVMAGLQDISGYRS